MKTVWSNSEKALVFCWLALCLSHLSEGWLEGAWAVMSIFWGVGSVVMFWLDRKVKGVR